MQPSTDESRTEQDAAQPVYIERSTAAGARYIFRRFALVAIGLNVVIAACAMIYVIADSISNTTDFLEQRGDMVGEILSRLQHSQPHLSDENLLHRVANLTGMPMALVVRTGTRSGQLGYMTNASIPSYARAIYGGSSPSRGVRVHIAPEYGSLSGAWIVRPLSETHDYLLIVPRLPEEEGLLVYMTVSAGVLGLGLTISFGIMLFAANWMIRRPLSRLVHQLTGALKRDVERRKKAEQVAVLARAELEINQLQLIQTAKLASLGEMATGVAHELNQPLNNIGLLVSRIEKRLPENTDEFIREKLEKISGQVQRASRIIEQLRAFGRPSAKNLEPIDLNEPIQHTLSMLQQQFADNGIAVVADIPTNLPYAIADSAQLEQVLINLMLNARDALDLRQSSQREKKISIAVTRTDSLIKISVSDNGSGMDPETIERIFEPFFSTKEVGKGTGLGLSISYSLIKSFGGDLLVESAVDEGTTFFILLKAAL